MGTRQVGLRDVEETRAPRRLRLLAPLRYLIIEAPEKRFYDRTLPTIAAAVVWAGWNYLAPRPLFFGPAGMLQVAQGFLMMAVPFLIGALAAVSMGSPGPHLDRRAVGAGLYLDGKSLTLRQFVSFLLGYLCFVGLVTFLLISAAIFVEPALTAAIGASTHWGFEALRQVGAFAAFFLFSSFTITVLWSLYFLTDIVNRTE